MRRDEAFVARALVEFLGGPSSASACEGEDPPDLYLTFGASRVGVEVTSSSPAPVPALVQRCRRRADFAGLGVGVLSSLSGIAMGNTKVPVMSYPALDTDAHKRIAALRARVSATRWA